MTPKRQSTFGSIIFQIFNSAFEAEVTTSANGSQFWAYLNEEGSSSGSEIAPCGPQLPAELVIGKVRHPFVQVQLNKPTGAVIKDFNKTRHVDTEMALFGELVRIKCRITRKKSGMWNLSFQANRSKKKKASALGSPSNVKKSEISIIVIEDTQI
jgi:hypothetical protein